VLTVAHGQAHPPGGHRVHPEPAVLVGVDRQDAARVLEAQLPAVGAVDVALELAADPAGTTCSSTTTAGPRR
jgi:hypothetical protein